MMKDSIQLKLLASLILGLGLGVSPVHAQTMPSPPPPPPSASNADAGVQTTQTAQLKSVDNKQTAEYNFVNADIESVVKAVGHFTGMNFIIDPKVKGQINLVSEKPVTKEQALKLLATQLRFQNFAVVTADGFSRIVPEVEAKTYAGPTSIRTVKGDQIVTQIFRINHESAANLANTLRPLVAPNSLISAIQGSNSLIVTDYADNLKRVGQIIATLDMPINSEIDIIPVRHAIASDLASIVTKLQEGGGTPGDVGKTIVMADSRTNSILVKGSTAAKNRLIKTLILQLDQPTQNPGNVHVVYLKNAEAVKLAQTLRSIYTGDNSNLASPINTSTPTPLPSMGNNLANAGQNTIGGTNSSANFSFNNANSNTSLPSGGAGFIQADATTNTLIITASEAVYKNLRSVIDQLDSRRAQVMIETLIVEVGVGKESELGVQWVGATGNKNSDYRVGYGTSFDADGNNIFNLIGGNATKQGSVLPGKGLSVGLFRQVGGQLNLGALARALSSDGDSNVLSVPNITTLDNEEAKIHVGKNVPFITGQFSNPGAGTGANPFQTISRQDVGIRLTVKPQISENGTVKLNIFQEVSSVDNTTNAAGIITSVRSLLTTVLAEDGQIIALGGLIDDDAKGKTEKVPFLGDIPLIGNLFKYQTQSRKKTNLMIFLRPTLLRDANESHSASMERYDYLRTQYIKTNDTDAQMALAQFEKQQKKSETGSNLSIKKTEPVMQATEPKKDESKLELKLEKKIEQLNQ